MSIPTTPQQPFRFEFQNDGAEYQLSAKPDETTTSLWRHQHFTPTPQTIIQLMWIKRNSTYYSVHETQCYFVINFLKGKLDILPFTGLFSAFLAYEPQGFKLTQLTTSHAEFFLGPCTHEVRKGIVQWTVDHLNSEDELPPEDQAYQQEDISEILLTNRLPFSLAQNLLTYTDYSILSLHEVITPSRLRFDTNKPTCFAFDLDEVLVFTSTVDGESVSTPVEANLGNTFLEISNIFKHCFFILITHSYIGCIPQKLVSLHDAKLDYRVFHKVIAPNDQIPTPEIPDKGIQLKEAIQEICPSCDQIVFVDDQSHNLKSVKESFKERALTLQYVSAIPHRIKFFVDKDFYGDRQEFMDSIEYLWETVSHFQYLNTISERISILENGTRGQT
ncbi:DUF2608 domain-containing protein [Parashewanella tropica]|uniref:DUF2608 domain-containing protein n=1 Tax=Parashewanella tropica TaxID=2547970 RepID=UPI00105A8581|nr:DUF2608 domain-containing protein [Parashewanella tropica]